MTTTSLELPFGHYVPLAPHAPPYPANIVYAAKGPAGERYTVKRAVLGTRQAWRQERERRILTRLEGDPFSPRLAEEAQAGGYVYLVVERPAGFVTLARFVALEKTRPAAAADFAVRMKLFLVFKNFVQGLVHIHALGVAHRRINPQTLVLNDQQGVMYTDFSDACFVADADCAAAPPPPELGGLPSVPARQADVWALGKAMYFLATCGKKLRFSGARPVLPATLLPPRSVLALFFDRTVPDALEQVLAQIGLAAFEEYRLHGSAAERATAKNLFDYAVATATVPGTLRNPAIAESARRIVSLRTKYQKSSATAASERRARYALPSPEALARRPSPAQGTRLAYLRTYQLPVLFWYLALKEQARNTPVYLVLAVPPPQPSASYLRVEWVRFEGRQCVGAPPLSHLRPTNLWALYGVEALFDVVGDGIGAIGLAYTAPLLKSVEAGLRDRTKKLVVLRFNLNVKKYDALCALQRCYRHATFIVLNKRTREVEQYDPHGRGRHVSADAVARSIKLFLGRLRNREDVAGYRIVASASFCPRLSVQPLEVAEQRSGDYGGFCTIWMLWLVALRLKHPDGDKEAVVRRGITALHSTIPDFNAYIRRYARNIEQHFAFYQPALGVALVSPHALLAPAQYRRLAQFLRAFVGNDDRFPLSVSAALFGACVAKTSGDAQLPRSEVIEAVLARFPEFRRFLCAQG